uniref:Uncharacterized protein n=1 Tax=Onchocerca volvulus TaxID=6282 RepID=A0A8R1Y5J5_ONCVO
MKQSVLYLRPLATTLSSISTMLNPDPIDMDVNSNPKIGVNQQFALSEPDFGRYHRDKNPKLIIKLCDMFN